VELRDAVTAYNVGGRGVPRAALLRPLGVTGAAETAGDASDVLLHQRWRCSELDGVRPHAVHFEVGHVWRRVVAKHSGPRALVRVGHFYGVGEVDDLAATGPPLSWQDKGRPLGPIVEAMRAYAGEPP
jgi:hypothetical protein